MTAPSLVTTTPGSHSPRGPMRAWTLSPSMKMRCKAPCRLLYVVSMAAFRAVDGGAGGRIPASGSRRRLPYISSAGDLRSGALVHLRPLGVRIHHNEETVAVDWAAKSAWTRSHGPDGTGHDCRGTFTGALAARAYSSHLRTTSQCRRRCPANNNNIWPGLSLVRCQDGLSGAA